MVFTGRKLAEYGHNFFGHIVGVHGRQFHVIFMVFIDRKLAKNVDLLATLFFTLLVCCYLNAMTAQKTGPSKFRF